MKKTTLFSIILIGFTAMVAQIVIMREFLIVFYGNEISIGIILSSWLIWGAVGSWFLGRFADKARSKLNLFSSCQLALSFFLPLSILAIRSIKILFKLAPGEIIGFVPMALSSFIILAPLCMLLGFMFSLACRMDDLGTDPAEKNALVYSWESVGAMLGGLLASFILIRLLSPIAITVILGLLNIIAAICLQGVLKKNKVDARKVGMLGVIFIAALALWISKGWDTLDTYARKQQWQGYEILASRNSIYGNIMVTKRGSEYSFFDNGLHLYTVPDRLVSEEAVHFALLEHKHPEEVLLVGGGLGGLIEEILKQPVKKIDYLELDPVIIDLAAQYLPIEEYAPLRNAKVSIFNLDGRFFIKNVPKKYDCVIMHLGDPYTAQVNRYYTLEFFREVKKVLKAGGIFSFALSASESYISPDQAEYLRSIYTGLKEVFKDTLVIPGDTAYFLSSDQEGLLTYDYKVLMERAKERNVELKYVREYYLFSKLSPQLVAYTLGALLKPGEVNPQVKDFGVGVKINRDFHPVAYYYNMIFWSARSGESYFKEILKAASSEKLRNVVLGICVLIILVGLIGIRHKQDFYKEISLMTLMVTGFSAMAIQIIILLVFQVIYGYVFYKIGLLLTAFMVGLAIGSFWMMKMMRHIKSELKILICLQLGFCVLFLALPVFFSWILAVHKEIIFQLGANAIFPLLSIIVGFISGGQFPLVNKIYLSSRQGTGQSAGLVYGVDLLGACFGASLTGILLIPVLGIIGSCFAITAINLSILVILIFSRVSYFL